MDISVSQQDLTLLPPAKDVCPTCAVKHDPDAPHNAQSLYYQYSFVLTYKRNPTWHDAMAHCSDEVKKAWSDRLKHLGIDIHSPNLTGNIQSQQEAQQRLKEYEE